MAKYGHDSVSRRPATRVSWAISRLFQATAVPSLRQTFGRSIGDNIAAITAFSRGDATGSPRGEHPTRVINLIETAILAPGVSSGLTCRGVIITAGVTE